MDIRLESIVRGVKPKGHLRTDNARERVISLLADRLRASFGAALERLSQDPDLLLLVARCIRNAGCKKHKFDEVELTCAVMQRLFPDKLDPARLEQMRALLRCFGDNGCIKKLGRLSRFWHWLFSSPGNDV